MNERPTPIVDSSEFTVPIAGKVIASKTARGLERERDEAREKTERYRLEANAMMMQRDEAREQVKELIYIADRAIALADIDFENDKFGVVSELRGGLQRIKEETKWVDQHQKQIRVVAMRYPATTGGLREAICTICKRIRAARLFMQRLLAGLSESATRRVRH